MPLDAYSGDERRRKREALRLYEVEALSELLTDGKPTKGNLGVRSRE